MKHIHVFICWIVHKTKSHPASVSKYTVLNMNITGYIAEKN